MAKQRYKFIWLFYNPVVVMVLNNLIRNDSFFLIIKKTEKTVFPSTCLLLDCTLQACKIPSRIAKEDKKKINVIERCVVTAIVSVDIFL